MTKVKTCSWQFYDVLITSLDKVYICKTCGHKLRLKSNQLPPTVTFNNECYENE